MNPNASPNPRDVGKKKKTLRRGRGRRRWSHRRRRHRHELTARTRSRVPRAPSCLASPLASVVAVLFSGDLILAAAVQGSRVVSATALARPLHADWARARRQRAPTLETLAFPLSDSWARFAEDLGDGTITAWEAAAAKELAVLFKAAARAGGFNAKASASEARFWNLDRGRDGDRDEERGHYGEQDGELHGTLH